MALHMTDDQGNTVTLYDLCHLIYKGYGQSAGLGFCDSIEHPTWNFCGACETESPVTDSPDEAPACLVCGSTV